MTPTEIRQKLHQQIDQIPVSLLLLVADFLEFLQFKQAKVSDPAQAVAAVEVLQPQVLSKRPRRSIRGLCADLDLSVSEDDIAVARREMWANFPAKDIA